ncbi:MAG: tyrosine-type recombinase/integrase [Candidatus Eremiobacteraeota bacterium]|nr:tyrosine-type recombinase/integrase [Candidatus Eremiobacteraeota bacterium]
MRIRVLGHTPCHTLTCSLFSFEANVRYLPYNLGAAIRVPRPPSKLTERILDERSVLAMLAAVEDHPRVHALLRLLYNGGVRDSELTAIRWRNLVDGVVNITGKGAKTRVVRLSRGTWDELMRCVPQKLGTTIAFFLYRPGTLGTAYVALRAPPA